MSSASSSPGFFIRLLDHREVAHRTFAFRFEKPPALGFFQPGQYLDLSIPDPPENDAEGNVRSFSICSSPGEPFLMIATRLRDTAFKRVLEHAGPRTLLKAEGPKGDLVLHPDASRPAVLLAGGIGITPFRSMVKYAVEASLSHRIFLFYSNRRPEDAPFLEELQALQGANPRFHLIATMTDMSRSRRLWLGETSRIDRAMLSRHLRDAASAIYYIAGPPGMVGALQSMLASAGIAQADIRAEEFSGY